MPSEGWPEVPDRGTMFCLGCEYVLDGLSSRACPECGRAFDRSDLTTYRVGPVTLDDPVRLARMTTANAVALRIRLDSQGIRSSLHEETAGVIGYAEIPSASIWVERADEDAARQVLNEPVEHVASSAWDCAHCGERIEAQFTDCWNCGAAHSE